MKSTSSKLSLALTLAMALVTAASAKPLKVYIMAGQSNMQGKARAKTFPAMAADPASKELHDRIVNEDGKPRVFEDVCVAAISSRRGQETTRNGPLTIGFGNAAGEGETAFGPELAFGATLNENLNEPILIIKTSWGGKDINTDFRPPSAGPFYPDPSKVKDKVGNKTTKAATLVAQKQKAEHVYYRKMMEHVKTVLADPKKYCPAYDPKEGYEVAGFVWFQGYNDMINGHLYPKKDGADRYKEYSRLLSLFIQDVRKDLEAPKMPFVIGVMGLGGNTDGPFQNAQAAPAEMPEFKGNVAAVLTGKYWDHKLGELDSKKGQLTDEEKQYLELGRSNAGFHYLGSAKIYSRIGEAFAKALLELEKTD